MRLKRKAALLLMAATLCVGMPANSVGATSWSCTHWQTVVQTSELTLFNTFTHKVYYDKYDSNDKPIYSICKVERYRCVLVKQCVRCSLIIREHYPEGDKYIHSLENDPYHKD